MILTLSTVVVRTQGSHAYALVPVLRIICCLIFLVAGLSEFGRSDGVLQPLDYSDAADKAVRRMIAVFEILAALLTLLPQFTSLSTGFLLALCVGSVVLDPKLIRRSPMLPLIVILLAIVCAASWSHLDYWHTHTINDMFD